MLPELTADDRARHEWQLNCLGVGEIGQRRLKGATVFISRCGGVGGMIAQHLAMAGVGRLIIAHGGPLRPSDLNRQGLMRDDGIGVARIGLIRQRLEELNPHIVLQTHEENVDDTTAERLMAESDIIACAAPLFQERFAMNSFSVARQKPFVHAAMYDFEVQIAVLHPPHTACFRCFCPAIPAWWKRQFPVFGAVAGLAGSLAATEIIKYLTGAGEPLLGQLLHGDLRQNRFRTATLRRDPDCPECSRIS